MFQSLQWLSIILRMKFKFVKVDVHNIGGSLPNNSIRYHFLQVLEGTMFSWLLAFTQSKFLCLNHAFTFPFLITSPNHSSYLCLYEVPSWILSKNTLLFLPNPSQFIVTTYLQSFLEVTLLNTGTTYNLIILVLYIREGSVFFKGAKDSPLLLLYMPCKRSCHHL